MDHIPAILSSLTREYFLASITTRSRMIYWIIIGSIILLIAALPFVYVDVSVLSRGYFQSNIEKQVLFTPFSGKVVFSSMQNGKRILKGDTLLIIDPETVKAQKGALIQKIAENEAAVSDLEKLTLTDFLGDHFQCKGLITPRYQAELANFTSLLAIQMQKLQKKQKDHERNLLLYNQELISVTDFENSLFNLNTEKETFTQIIENQRSVWYDDLAIRVNERLTLSAELKQCAEGLINRTLTASVNGEIIQSSDLQVGSIVSQGQNIGEISPEGAIVATCFVNPSDIGLLHTGQVVKLQVDAFNYREWGMLNGKIIGISDDMIFENESSAYFRIKCKPESLSVSLRDGRGAFVKKGMSFTARIIVTRRSLFNLLFDKVDKWFNPYDTKSKEKLYAV